jgi:CHASE3 domain sensor protein
MADQEVIKHTKKIFKIWSSPEHSFWHKVREFFLEIFIIVFAVSLSIWLHERSEHQHQQEEVKEFLLGIRADFLSDIKEMKEDKKSYLNQGKVFKYVYSVKLGQPVSADSIYKYRNYLFNTTRLNQNSGRFEGFKASGKIGLIEDEIIQNDIMDLYQESIPSLLLSTDAYIDRKNAFFAFQIKNEKRLTDSTTNFLSLLATEEAHNLSYILSGTGEIRERYDICIKKMNQIVANIDKKYGNAD